VAGRRAHGPGTSLAGRGPGQHRARFTCFIFHLDRFRSWVIYEHLHNNVLQLGAERGLPCLASWLWLMVRWSGTVGRFAPDFARTRGSWMLPLAGWLAFFLEGLFECNFGTSPVLIVFLFVMSTPLIVQRSESGEGEASHPASSLLVSA